MRVTSAEEAVTAAHQLSNVAVGLTLHSCRMLGSFFFFFLSGYRLPAGSAADLGAILEMRRHKTGNARGSKM